MTNVVILTKEEYREMNHIPKLRANQKSKPENQATKQILPLPKPLFDRKMVAGSLELIDNKNLRNSLSPITHHESMNENNETLRAIEMLDREKPNFLMSPELHTKSKPHHVNMGNFEGNNQISVNSLLRGGEFENERLMLETAKKAYEEEIAKVIDLRANLERNLAQQQAKRGNKNTDEFEEDGIWKQRYEDVWRSRKVLEVEISQLKNNLDYFERQIKIIVEEKNTLTETHKYKIDQMVIHSQGLIKNINELEKKIELDKESFSEQLQERDNLLFQKTQELHRLTQEYTSLIKEVNEERQKEGKINELFEENKDLRMKIETTLLLNSEVQNIVAQKEHDLLIKEEYIKELLKQINISRYSSEDTDKRILALDEKAGLLSIENEKILRIVREKEIEISSKDEKLNFMGLQIEKLEILKIEMESDVLKVLSTVNNERKTFEAQISALNSYIAKLERDLDSTRDFQDFRKSRISEKSFHEGRSPNKAQTAMEEEILRLNKEVDRLNLELQGRSNELQSFGVPNSLRFEERTDVRQLRDALDFAERDLIILREENVNLKMMLDRKNSELELWIQKFKNESRSHDLNEILADYEVARKNAIEKQVEAIKSQLQGEKLRLEAALSEQFKKQEEYEKKINSLVQENITLSEEAKEKNNNYQELYGQYRDGNNRLGGIKKEKEDLKLKYEALQTSLQTTLEQKEISIKNIENKLKILKMKKKTYKKSNQELLNNIEQLKEDFLAQGNQQEKFPRYENAPDFSSAREDLSKAREEIDHLKNLLKLREKEINAQKQMIENFKLELEHSENDKRKIKEDYNGLLNQYRNGGGISKPPNSKSDSMMHKKTDWSVSDQMFENHYETSQFQMSMKKDDRDKFKRLQEIESRRINQAETNHQKEFLKVIPEIVVTHSRPIHLAELQTASSQPFFIKDSLSFLK